MSYWAYDQPTGLGATEYDINTLENYEGTEQWSEGVGSITTKVGRYVQPGGKEVIVSKEVQILNQAKTVIRHELEIWDYESVHKPPIAHYKEIKARLWLPWRDRRTGLKTVETQKTVYWFESVYAQSTGELSYRTVREGEVIYRMGPADRVASAAAIEKYEGQGRESSDAQETAPFPLRIIVDSAQTWESAISKSAVVENERYPSKCIWRRIETVEHMVHETWALIISETYTKDHLHPGNCSYDGPHITKKPGVVFELPVPLEPPVLTDASERVSGVYLRAEGGNAVVEPFWATPNGTKVPIIPELYRFYRRVINMPSRSYNDDPYDTWETPPTASSKYNPPVVEDPANPPTNVAGVPTSSLPAAGADTEPEDPSPPDAEYWEMIAEVSNMETDKWSMGWAVATDADLESGATYVYRATAVRSDQESEPSNEIEVTIAGASSPRSRMTTVILPKVTDEEQVVTIDVVAPDDVEIEDALGDMSDEYGETVVLKNVPVALDDNEFTAEALGDDIGEAQMTRNQSLRRVRVTPTIPILGIARGELITIPAIGWKTYGNDRIITSETDIATLRVDGWGLSISGNGESFELLADPLSCLEVRE